MSEAAEKLDDAVHEPEVQENEPEKQVDTEALMAELNAKIEEKAKAGGWMSFEEHVAAGREPEEWRDARGFLDYGEMQERIQRFQHGYDTKARDVAKYHEALYEIRKKELEDKFNDAVDQGDPEKIRKAKNAIDEHGKIEPEDKPAKQGIPPEVAEWNAKNPWINQHGAKSLYAKTIFAQACNSGLAPAEALALVEQEVAKEFPQDKASRGHVPGSEAGKNSRGSRGKSRDLSWEDLSQEELNVFKTGIFGEDKARFLRKTKDAREAAAKAGE